MKEDCWMAPVGRGWKRDPSQGVSRKRFFPLWATVDCSLTELKTPSPRRCWVAKRRRRRRWTLMALQLMRCQRRCAVLQLPPAAVSFLKTGRMTARVTVTLYSPPGMGSEHKLSPARRHSSRHQQGVTIGMDKLPLRQAIGQAN